MTLEDATKLIEQGVTGDPGIWADIGAGTGMFTQALMSAFAKASAHGGGSRIYAVDKSPHALWALKATSNIEIMVVEADFNNPLDLPLLDGIVMANALHYAKDHLVVLNHVLETLKSGGTFILVEYDTEIARPPWVPNPVSFKMFENLCTQAGLKTPSLIGEIDSVYGSDRIYSATAMKQ